MSNLRILFAADVAPSPDSGAGGTEYQTAEALRRLGHDVDTLWAADLDHRWSHGNLHYLLELPGAYRRAIAARCRVREYDVIHANQPHAWLAARHHRASRRPGVFVNRSHGWEPRVRGVLHPWRRQYGVPEWRGLRGVAGRPLRWVLDGLYPRAVVRYSDGIIVSCADDRDYVRARYAVDPARVACIPQAPPALFQQRPVAAMTRERLGRVLYVGQDAFFKGGPVLTEVFSRLAAGLPELELTWCCNGSAHARIQAGLRPEVARKVRWVPWMPQERLVDLYDGHGIFLFPSFSEGFGKVFLEAMARGLCVVASAVGGMRDVIASGRDGWLVASGDVDGLVTTVARVAGNLDEASRVSQAASQTASAYTWDRVAHETAAFYAALRAMRAG